MTYSPEVQARLDAKSNRSSGPSFPMPRLRHNGDTGEWLVREVVGDKNADDVTVFDREGMKEAIAIDKKTGNQYKAMVGGSWKGVVLRVAFKAQSKYKPDAVVQKVTREFTSWKEEPIELMKRTFGSEGKTELLKTYLNYQDFKAGTMLKDEDGNPVSSPFDLKVCLYVYHLERRQTLKLECGGTARSEWFEYEKSKASGDGGIKSTPWKQSFPDAKVLDEIVTEFSSTLDKNAKGLEYHHLNFKAVGVVGEDRIVEVLDESDKIQAWVDAWKKVNAKPSSDADKLSKINSMASEKPLPIIHVDEEETPFVRESKEEIRLEDIPF
ncbi:MAG: hypothetical protein WC776_05110 [Patescibacteria group bacterium]|jgi:hypothetical protein